VILDSSAIVSVLLAEPGSRGLAELMAGADRLGVGAATLVEASIVLTARAGPAGVAALEALLADAEVTVVPFTDAHWRVARSAFARFGEGRHPAALNLGDCYSYATARVAGQPLLCVGDDFPRTDLPLVTVPT
jgi:ribonuclease VapC